jgi:hypothetical protein
VVPSLWDLLYEHKANPYQSSGRRQWYLHCGTHYMNIMLILISLEAKEVVSSLWGPLYEHKANPYQS